MGDIIRHIEGPIGVARRGDDNPRPADSPFEDLWNEVDTSLCRSIIDRTTFADLLVRWKEKRSRQAASWQI